MTVLFTHPHVNPNPYAKLNTNILEEFLPYSFPQQSFIVATAVRLQNRTKTHDKGMIKAHVSIKI